MAASKAKRAKGVGSGEPEDDNVREVGVGSVPAPSAADNAAGDSGKRRVQRALNGFVAERLVETATAAVATVDLSRFAAEAILQIKEGRAPPKYFSGEPPNLASIATIDQVAKGTSPMPSGEEESLLVNGLFSDLFPLCMACKLRPGEPATAEDPNFDVDTLDAFLAKLSHNAHQDSLEALGRFVDAVLVQGIDELANSSAKLRAVVVALAHPALADPASEPFEVLKRLLRLVALLWVTPARDTLVRWYASLPLAFLERCLSQLQQFLTVSLLAAGAECSVATLDAMMHIARSGDLARHTRHAMHLMDIYWRANEQRRQVGRDWRTVRKAQLARQQGQVFDTEALQSICVSQFHNDAINDCEGLLKHDLKEVLDMQHQGRHFTTTDESKRSGFGVVQFPFVLTPYSKVRMLHIEFLLWQREEVRHVARRLLIGNPFLVLKVRRSQVIQDALQQLAQQSAQNFRRPLKIVFDGEEGVDEGGVQKEFFQLLICELYNEEFGMFELIEDNHNFWFNKNSLEAKLQFELFGTVLGLAMYNQVILDVQFPSLLYKKLMGGTSASQLGLSDLLEFQPTLAQGFIQLLEYTPVPGSSLEDVFGPLRFVVEYDYFGATRQTELCEGGKDMPVTFENREAYVQRYCDWIFNVAVQPQFDAFRKGFDHCIGNTLFRQLFRAEELELVICGTPELDFQALEKVAQYQDGFTCSSQVIKWFWEVVHSLDANEKKNFLQYCTGCGRAPVGGLGRLPFIISRKGPDSAMLPSVHTCFNHLLVPDYSSKEKLERLLRLALEHSTGFGLM